MVQLDIFQASPPLPKVAANHKENCHVEVARSMNKTLTNARAAADKGMRRALDHAEAEIENWGDLAVQWLWQYARKHELFTPEECNQAALAWGLIKPTDDRAWGMPYRRAIKLGYIEKSDVLYARTRGHGSPGRKWRSKVFVRVVQE